MSERVDIAIIGAGAAGLMAAIWAGRTSPGLRVVALDGAKKLGAKILVAGGGRCNVTHHQVSEQAYAGSSRNAIKKVLRSFDVPRVVEFFAQRGVELKREETGKLFPVTDDAQTVLDALLGACEDARAELWHPWRVASVRREGEEFVIERTASDESLRARSASEGVVGDRETRDHPSLALRARRVILCTGGMALPRSGSDGAGYGFAKSLGHTVSERVFPALVPIVVDGGFFTRALSGLTIDAALAVHSGTGKKLIEFTNSTLLTHFGLSGPSVLDISRYYFDTRHHDSGASLRMNLLPGRTLEQIDAELTQIKVSPGRWIKEQGLPERLGDALCAHVGVEASSRPDHLRREQRRALATALTQLVIPVTGDRGFTYAEVTAGGVPLSEVHLETMESRVCPGLHIAGEVCDVDGRIGGFNFQWAWASGYLAGVGAARGLAT